MNRFDEYCARINWWRARKEHPEKDLQEEADYVMAFYARIGVLPRWAEFIDSLVRHQSQDFYDENGKLKLGPA